MLPPLPPVLIRTLALPTLERSKAAGGGDEESALRCRDEERGSSSSADIKSAMSA